MKVKIGGRRLKGTGADDDKLLPREIAWLKEVRFNKQSGKREGGQYYNTFTVRKYFRRPEVIAQKLRSAKNRVLALDQKRSTELGRTKHRRTMTEHVEKAMDLLASNAVHLYDVGDPYVPAGMKNGAPHYKAARGTNLTETLNSLFPIMLRGGNCSLVLAVTILLTALTVFNTDRRRAAKLELDYGHYDRALVERINALSRRVLGRALYDGELASEKLRDLLPDSGARFIADVDIAPFEPHARLRERNKKRLGKRAAAAANDGASANDDGAVAAYQTPTRAHARGAGAATSSDATAARAAASSDATAASAAANSGAAAAPRSVGDALVRMQAAPVRVRPNAKRAYQAARAGGKSNTSTATLRARRSKTCTSRGSATPGAFGTRPAAQ